MLPISSATGPERESFTDLQREIWLARIARARSMTISFGSSSPAAASGSWPRSAEWCRYPPRRTSSSKNSRWARGKDIDDARDVLAVQDSGRLDMAYVCRWCERHGTLTTLEAIMAALPEA